MPTIIRPTMTATHRPVAMKAVIPRVSAEGRGRTSLDPASERLLWGRAVWWRWLRWVAVAVFIAAFIPSLFDRRLVWIWMVAWGIVV
jgi:hypothetical protein